MHRLLAFLLLTLSSLTAFTQRNDTDAAFARQLRAIILAGNAELLEGELVDEKEGTYYTIYGYECKLPLDEFELSLYSENGWYNMTGEYFYRSNTGNIDKKLLAAFRSLGNEFTVEDEILDVSKKVYVNKFGKLNRIIRLEHKASERSVSAHFMTDGRVMLDFTLNLETEQSKWDHAIHNKISTEAECFAAMNQLMAKVAGKTFTNSGVSRKINKMEIRSDGAFISVTATYIKDGKKISESSTASYTGINWKEGFEFGGQVSVIPELTVLVIQLPKPARATIVQNGKPSTVEYDEIEELAVLSDDSKEMLAYLNWLNNQ